MQAHELPKAQASVGHAQAVIDAANDMLERRLERRPASACVIEWFSDQLVVSAGAAPGDGVVLTVKPRRGPASLVRGASVVLYPDDDALPVRFGVLDRHGQLNVTGLDEGSYRIELHAPWWLDDRICDDVRAGELKWAFIDAPVILPRALEAREQRRELAAARTRQLISYSTARYLSGDQSLEYRIRKSDVLEVKAWLHTAETAGRAAVYLGEVVSPITSQRTIQLPSSLLAGGAATMRCVRLIMLGTRPQQPPPVPWTISVEIDERLEARLTSDSVKHRWAAATELRTHLQTQTQT